MTRLQIRDKVRKLLGETTASFWSDAELNLWIDTVISDIAWRTKCLRTNTLITPTVDQLEYVLSAIAPTLNNVLEVYQFSNGKTWERLTRMKRDDLDNVYPGWRSAESGTPIHYDYDVEEDMILFYPAPDSSNSGASSIKIFHSYRSTSLSSDISIPQIPLVLHDAIVTGTLITGCESRGLGDRANNFRQIFLNAINDYLVERAKDLDENIVMKNYRNV